MKGTQSAILLALVALLIGSAGARSSPPPIHFSRDILPILSQNCFQCHGPDEKARKAKLRLDQRDGAMKVIVPGKGEASELIRRISSPDPEERMPPSKTNRKLTTEQKDLLRRWIDQGAVWQKHWAYETPVRPNLPPVQQKAWPKNGIDHFILARLEREGLKPSSDATKETLLRRVTLDLTGLPPTPAEVHSFLADQAPDAYKKVVDRLLASERYGERMAMDWLDDARFADTNGYQNDFARTMWPWRDWVIAAYNRNLPFDQFVIEQIAGDMLPGATLQQKIASGFNRNNRTVTEAGSIDEEWRVENAVDRVETTTTVFLGLTMGCCRCHDHKFDPISQREFYQFFGFFNSVNEKGVYTEQRGNVPPLVMLASPDEQRTLRELSASIAVADKTVRDNSKGDTSRFAREAKLIADKLRREKDELEKKIATVMVMEDSPKPRDTFVLKRGRYELPDKSQKVEPGVPACLSPMSAGWPRNRLGLARWLVDPANPLTARVAVNRFWQRYFGVGLVKSTENFGVQGEAPSHPELLDWLATEFVRTGWNIKEMQKLLVMSATYRQASATTPELLQRDPGNRLLARGPRFRLPAEVLRDNALAISGLLVEKLGGPSIKPYQPAGLWEELAGGAGEAPYVQEKGAGLYRRSLYIYRKRTVPHPTMATFDAPSREVCFVKRARTNTPLQALELMNDVTYVEAARALAQRMLTEGGNTPEERLAFAFRRATARAPDAREQQVILRGLQHYQEKFRADPESARRFVHNGDSAPNDKLTATELAAYTAAASVILNLDETITKE